MEKKSSHDIIDFPMKELNIHTHTQHTEAAAATGSKRKRNKI